MRGQGAVEYIIILGVVVIIALVVVSVLGGFNVFSLINTNTVRVNDIINQLSDVGLTYSIMDDGFVQATLISNKDSRVSNAYLEIMNNEDSCIISFGTVSNKRKNAFNNCSFINGTAGEFYEFNCSVSYTSLTGLNRNIKGVCKGLYDESINDSVDLNITPYIIIESPLNATYPNVTVLINLSSDGDNVWYNWNGSNTTYSSPVNVNFNVGINTLTAWANNSLGNLNSTSVTFTVENYSLFSINFDIEGNWIAGSGLLTSYQNNHKYIQNNWTFTGGPALRQTTASQDGFPGAYGIYAWRLTDNSVNWYANYSGSNKTTGFGFAVRRWDGSPETIRTVYYSLDGGLNYNSTGIIINNTFLNGVSDWKILSYNFTQPVSFNNGFVVRVQGTTGERIMIDNFFYYFKTQ